MTMTLLQACEKLLQEVEYHNGNTHYITDGSLLTTVRNVIADTKRLEYEKKRRSGVRGNLCCPNCQSSNFKTHITGEYGQDQMQCDDCEQIFYHVPAREEWGPNNA